MTWRLDPSQFPLTPAERDIVLEIILRCEPDFATLRAAVVMDDHALVLAQPKSGISCKTLESAWKGASSHRCWGAGRRNSPLWQREYFDRWIHTPDQLISCVRYIHDNPMRRWPGMTEYPWLVVR